MKASTTFPPSRERRRLRHFRALHASSRTTGQFACGNLASSDNRPDFVERQIKHVVQHIGHTLCRSQRFEYDQQSQSNRVRDHRFSLGIDAGLESGDLTRQFFVKRVLCTGLARSQHVKAHPRPPLS